MNIFVRFFYIILLLIDSLVYMFISLLFQLFIVISRASIFGPEELRVITDKIFVIMGVFLLFYVSYEILTLIANPEKLSGGSKGTALVTKFITTIIVLILLPTIFTYLHTFQNNVVSSNIIGNVILGSVAGERESENLIASSSVEMSLSIAQAFYHPIINGVDYDETACTDLIAGSGNANSDAIEVCTAFTNALNDGRTKNGAGAFFLNTELKDILFRKQKNDTDTEATMTYYPLLSTLAGVVALWMIISYCLDIGVRVAKLAFYEIIAPIPIVQNISKDGSILSTKWFQNFISTYIDIFVRLIVIFLSMEMIKNVPSLIIKVLTRSDGGGPVSETSFMIRMLATVIIILGILKFAKDAPSLIEDLFGGKGMGLMPGPLKRIKDNEYVRKTGSKVATIGGAIGATSGAHFSQAFKSFKSSGEPGISAEDETQRRKAGWSHVARGAGGIFTGAGTGLWAAREAETAEDAKKATLSTYADTTEKIKTTDERRTRIDQKVKEAKADSKGAIETSRAFQSIKVRGAESLETILELPKRFWSGFEDDFRKNLAGKKNPLADSIISNVNSIFDNFDTGAIKDLNSWEDAAYKSFREGKSVTISEVTDRDGNVILPEVKPKSTKDIKDHYDDRRAAIRAMEYNKYGSDLRKSIEKNGEAFVTQLNKTLEKLSTKDNKVFFEKLDKHNIKTSKDVEQIFKNIGEGTVTHEQLKGLETIKSAMNDVKKFNYQLNPTVPESKK